MKENYFLKGIPDFYREIFYYWSLSRDGQTSEPKTFVEIWKHVIWNNKFIKNNDKTLAFTSWIKSDIIFVNDIFDVKGDVLQEIFLK